MPGRHDDSKIRVKRTKKEQRKAAPKYGGNTRKENMEQVEVFHRKEATLNRAASLDPVLNALCFGCKNSRQRKAQLSTQARQARLHPRTEFCDVVSQNPTQNSLDVVIIIRRTEKRKHWTLREIARVWTKTEREREREREKNSARNKRQPHGAYARASVLLFSCLVVLTDSLSYLPVCSS